MKKIMKKAFGLMLALVMVVGLMPVTAKAATANVDTFNPDGTTEYTVTYTAALPGGIYDENVYAYSWTPSSNGVLTLTATSDDAWVVCTDGGFGGGQIGGDTTTASFDVTAGTEYRLMVYTWSEGPGIASFTAAFEEKAGATGSGTENDPYDITAALDSAPAVGHGSTSYYMVTGLTQFAEYNLKVTTSNTMGTFTVADMAGNTATSTQMGPMSAGATIKTTANMRGMVMFTITSAYGDCGPFAVSVESAAATVGTSETPDELPVNEQLENPIQLIAHNNVYLYYYTWTAEETGKLSITTIGRACTNNAWKYSVSGGEWEALLLSSADEPVVNPGEYYVKAGEKITVWFAMPDYSAGQVYFTATFEKCDYPVLEGPKFESVTDDNYQMATTGLVVGDNDVNVSDSNETLYEFTAEETAVYEISVETGYIGYWGSGASLATTGVLTNPNSTVQKIEVTLKANESAIVGLTDVDTDTAVITVKKVKDVADEENLPWTEYENESEIKDYTFEGTFDSTENYVDVEDDVVDKAVLGEDGYYHLNTADGPILLVKLDGKYGSIDPLSMAKNNALKGYDADGSKWDYSAAYLEYYAAADETTGLYPLTADLIAILQNAGETQGWYSEVLDDVTTEDGWMFNLYYVPITASAPAPIDPTDTGDHSNIALWIAVLGLGVVAIAGSVVMKKREF